MTGLVRLHSAPAYRDAMARYREAAQARTPDTALCEGLWLDVLAIAQDLEAQAASKDG